MHDTKGQHLDPNIDEGDFPDNEDALEGDASLYRSFGEIMGDDSRDEKVQGREETESETENVDFVIEHGMDDVEGAGATTGVEKEEEKKQKKKGILKKEETAKEREKTPEDEELPDEVPETPQPERKKRKVDYE